MYLSSRQYPEFKGLASREQSAILKAALQAHDPSQWKRFVGALLGSLALGVGAGVLSGNLGVSEDNRELLAALVTGGLFYVYLLWEINGSTRAAVVRHLASGSSAQP